MISRGCWDQISEIKFLKSKFGPNKLNHAQNYVFRHFLYFGSTVFLEIAYNNSLKQCLTSSRGDTYEKNWGRGWRNLGENPAQKQVFCYFLKFGDNLELKCIR